MTRLAARQAVRGTHVGHEGTARCAECNAALGEGSAVGALVHRLDGEGVFTVGALYCGPCRPARVRYPMQGIEEYTIHARLGTVNDVATQDHWLAVVAPEIVDSAPLREGIERANARSYAGP